MAETAETETFEAVCVNPRDQDLTLGAKYIVKESSFFRHMYAIVNDLGARVVVFKDRFRVLETSQVAVEKPDAVNHPSHYGGADNPYEAIKIIEALGLGFNTGNALKYLSRAGKKTPDALEDLKKAAWYLNREIKNLEAK